MAVPPLARDLRAWAHAPPNPLTRALTARREAGLEVIDLVSSSATDYDLVYPADRLAELAAEAAARAVTYRPDPRGQRDARDAVAAFYERRGVPTHADDIVLTPGTSMAYLYLLRLLCNVGDEVLVPHPGYPLFDDLCTFAGVRRRFYHLRPGRDRWEIDLDDLVFQCTPRTRAVILVSPHNPLGRIASASELEALAEQCERLGVALIFDEVFSELVAPHIDVLPRPPVGPLTIVLNGVSKMLALPGVKLGWMRISPSGSALAEGVEYASDLFLPVSEITQAMAAPLLATADTISARIAGIVNRRRALAQEALGRPTLHADGSPYICVPVRGDEDALALAALDVGVHVHPGHFYALEGHLVFTCLQPEAALSEGVRRLGALLG